MGWFRRPTPIDPTELERLRSELHALRGAIEHQRSSTAEIDRRLRPAAMPPPPRTSVQDLVSRLAALERQPPVLPDTSRIDDLAARLDQLDDRLTAVSTELANQLNELGKELDALDPGGSGNGHADDAVLADLRDGQVRLATEQARYQIAFREDLSRLAEHLRRPST